MKRKSKFPSLRKMMFEKIEIERAENGYIVYIDRGLPMMGGFPLAPKVFISERALIKELRRLLKGDVFNINFKDLGVEQKNK